MLQPDGEQPLLPTESPDSRITALDLHLGHFISGLSPSTVNVSPHIAQRKTRVFLFWDMWFHPHF